MDHWDPTRLSCVVSTHRCWSPRRLSSLVSESELSAMWPPHTLVSPPQPLEKEEISKISRHPKTAVMSAPAKPPARMVRH